MGRSPGDEPQTLTRCHSCVLPQLYEAFEGWKSVCGGAYNLKGIERKFLFFFFLSFASFLGMMRADPVVTGKGDSIMNININLLIIKE